jgi:hypothetical protein
MTIKNGDLAAMPELYWSMDAVGVTKTCARGGMNKREMFAMAAMQGLLASLTPGDDLSPRELARSAVLNADTLLAELERTK